MREVRYCVAVATIVANIWDLRYCVAVATIIACRKMRFQKCAVTTAHLHVCAHAMRVIQPCAFGTVYMRGYNRALRSMVSCMSTSFMRGYNRALRSMAICRLPRVPDHIFLALQTAFRVQCQRNTWPWLYSAGSSRLPKSTKTGTSPSHRRRGPGTPSRKHVD